MGDVVKSLKEAKPCCTEETYTYLADYNREGEEDILDEISKFASEEGKKFRTMFERAIQRTAREYKTIGKRKGIEQGQKEANTLWADKLKEAQSRDLLDSKPIEVLLANIKMS